MIVTDIELKSAKACQLKAKVETAPEEYSELFYRLPEEFTQSLLVSADPFIAALLIPSMQLGETLTVNAPAAPRLLRALPKIMAFYNDWGPQYKVIEVRTPKERQESNSISKANALFFSGGVDSFYALTKLTEQTAEKNHLSHLIFVHGFDIKLNDNILFDRSYAAVKDIASYYGKKLVLVSTNVRAITDKYVGWDNCYGSVMASVALCFNGFFDHVYIASDLAPDESFIMSSQLSKSKSFVEINPRIILIDEQGLVEGLNRLTEHPERSKSLPLLEERVGKDGIDLQ